MKTYTQKQYESVKIRAYKKGYSDAQEEMTMDEALENAEQVKSWNKYEEADFNWGVVLVILITLAIVVTIIQTNNHVISNF
jgi:hypothetical protein